MPKLLIPIVLCSLVLVGCGGTPPPYGHVDVWWADGAGSDTGVAYVYDDVQLTMAIAAEGDAAVVDGYWSVAEQPFFSTVVLDDPLSSSTAANFDTPGWYVLHYTVVYLVGFDEYTTTSTLYLEIMPSGIG